jgi:hypothetical protein
MRYVLGLMLIEHETQSYFGYLLNFISQNNFFNPILFGPGKTASTRFIIWYYVNKSFIVASLVVVIDESLDCFL